MGENLPDTSIKVTGTAKTATTAAGIINNVVGYGSCICLGILNWSISKVQD